MESRRTLEMELYLAIPIALWAWALYSAYWRLYLSPISHIPGPKLAALTRLSVLIPILSSSIALDLHKPVTKRTTISG